ncbi:RNA polymerase sigma factor [Streptomyces lunaelactis]|uniref:RNA polymerase sigma factor n=1 Tax=Streptomyces lunaelactis TaxID=1535768 RepID=UPI00281584E9|nr:sigma-70 family RNA polymerase sigma factor [Streptomyces lunaelactis]
MAGDGDERNELLVVRCQVGEREAFTELVNLWHTPLWRYLRGVVGSAHVASDLAQETWVAVVRGLPRLRQPDRFTSWLFTIGRRSVANHLRDSYSVRDTTAREAEVATEDDNAPSGVLDSMEIQAGLSGLPPQEREVLILFHLEDLPLATCAAVLDVPPGTIKSRLHRARHMLRNILTERGYEA